MRFFCRCIVVFFISGNWGFAGDSTQTRDDPELLRSAQNDSSTVSAKVEHPPPPGGPFGKRRKLPEYKISLWKTGLVSGVTIGAGIWLHNYQKNAWWSGQRRSFHFYPDWDYAMYADKAGHFFDGAFIHNLYRGAFEWSGFSPTAAMWMGTAFSIAYLTDIEIEDGFATDWGFSWGDELANILGAMYPVAQHYWTPLKEFNLKWSYFPSPALREGKKQGAFIDDYDGQTVWLSMGIHYFLPKKAKKYWPDFLNLALGYGVKDYHEPNAYKNFYIAFDYDLRKLIPGDSKFLLWFKDVINHFRIFPAPGIRINNKGVEYVINF
jgi:hypothetical protein